MLGKGINIIGGAGGTAAVATFLYLYGFDIFAEARGSAPLVSIFGILLLALTLSSPLLPIVAMFRPGGATIWAAIHASVFATLLFMCLATSRPGFSSPGDQFASAINRILVVIFVVQIVLLTAALIRSRSKVSFPNFMAAFPGLAFALLIGWFLGIWAWSETLPSRLLASAEAAAGTMAYCIEVDGKPIKGKRDLVMFPMLTWGDGWFSNFYALVVIGSGVERRYANWSYRQGVFATVSEKSIVGLRLNEETRCTPHTNFVADLH